MGVELSSGTNEMSLVERSNELMDLLRKYHALMGETHESYHEVQGILREDKANLAATLEKQVFLEQRMKRQEVLINVSNALLIVLSLYVVNFTGVVEPQTRVRLDGLLIAVIGILPLLKSRLLAGTEQIKESNKNGFAFAEKMADLNQRAQTIVDTYRIENPDTDPHLVLRS